jgi:hypothetical protein
MESINTQRRRAGLPERFRKIRFFSARLFQGQSTAEKWVGAILSEGFEHS